MKMFFSITIVLTGEICFGQTVQAVKVPVERDSSCSVVTVARATNSKLLTGSNPATSTQSFQLAKQNARIRFLNLQGKNIKNRGQLNNLKSINVSYVSEEVYIQQILNEIKHPTIKIIVT